MNTGLIKFLLRLALFIIKTGQVKNALALVVLVIKAKLSYDEAAARMNGSYYDRQIKEAADKYHAKQPPVRVEVTGYARWRAEQERERFR